MSGSFTLTGRLMRHDKVTPHADAPIQVSAAMYPDGTDEVIYAEGASLVTDVDGSFSIDLLTETDLYYTVTSTSNPTLFDPITFLSQPDGSTHDLSEFTTTSPGAVTPSVLADALAAEAGAIAAAASAASAEAGAYPSASRLYVDPAAGNDANTGHTWVHAFATLSAAVAAAPTAAEIILAATDHDVGAGISVSNSKLLTIRGATPTSRRQHGGGTGQARLFSTAGTLPAYFLRLQSTDGLNKYGWHFADIYIDGDTIAHGGAFVEAHAVNRAIMERISARTLTALTGGDDRYLVKADMGGGDDASWWTLKDCTTVQMRACIADTSLNGKANYWTFPGSMFSGIVTATKPAGPAITVSGSQPNFNGLECDGWATAIQATNCRGVQAIGLAGEWNDDLLHMTGCYESIVTTTSTAGTGSNFVIDENGLSNTIIGSRRVKRLGTTERLFKSGPQGITPVQGAGGTMTPIYGAHPTLPLNALETPPGDVLTDLGLNGLTLEYWDGSAWSAWAAETNGLHQSDGQNVLTVDATHARFRISVNVGNANGPGLIWVMLGQSSGTVGTLTYRMCDSSNVTVTSPGGFSSLMSCGLGDSQYGASLIRGALISCEQIAGHHVELEFNLGLTGVQTASLKRAAFFHPGDHSGAVQPPKIIVGRKAPDGLVVGNQSDLYRCAAPTAIKDRGWWVKMSGTGTNTGWVPLAHAPQYPVTAVTGSRGGNAALASLLTALAATGLITDSST